MKSQEIKLFILLVSLSLITSLSIDMYLPSMANIMQFFKANYNSVQLTMSVYLLAYAITQLVFGPLSDHFGRKNILLMGLTLYFLASLWCALSTSVTELILARLLQGAGACGGIITAFAIARDEFKSENLAKVISNLSLSMTISAVIAPILGGFIATAWGWRSVFIVLSVTAAALIAVSYYQLPRNNKIELKPNKNVLHKSLLGYQAIMLNKKYMSALLNIVLAFTTIMIFLSYSPFFLHKVAEASSKTFGLILGLNSISLIASNLLASRLTKKYPLEKIIVISTIPLLFSGLLLIIASIFFHAIPQGVFIVSLFLGCASVAVIIPLSVSLALSAVKNSTATAASFFGFTRYAFAGLSVFALGHVVISYPLIFSLFIFIGSLSMFINSRNYSLKERGVGMEQNNPETCKN